MAGYLGNAPTAVPLTSADITDSTITNADIANSTINLTQKVTGALPVANGGTGLTALGSSLQVLRTNTGATALEFATISTGASAGQVIQVISATDSTQRSTSSSSFVTASNTLSVTITPSSTSNKIFIIVTSNGYADANEAAFYTIFRDSTDLGATSNKGFALNSNNTGAGVVSTAGMSYLDSPNTTSAITYQVYLRRDNNTALAYINSTSSKGVITCMEIKG